MCAYGYMRVWVHIQSYTNTSIPATHIHLEDKITVLCKAGDTVYARYEVPSGIPAVAKDLFRFMHDSQEPHWTVPSR